MTDEQKTNHAFARSRSNVVLEGTCKKCGGAMKPGKAIAQTWVGTPEWPGEWRGATMSPGGTGKLIDCMKCEACGWSITSNDKLRG